MPPGIGYPSTSTAPVQTGTPAVSSPPKKRDKKTEEMLRLAARIYARGGDDNDVASVFFHGYGVKLPGFEDQKTGDQDATMSGKAGYLRGLSMNALNGLTFGFGDEAVGSILGILTGEGASSGIDTYRKELQQFNEQNRKAALVSEIAGGLLLGGTGGARALGAKVAAKGTAGRIGASAGIGAGAGALYGAGNAEGNFLTGQGLSERAKGAVVGGVTGAVAGAIVGTGLTPALTLAGAGVGSLVADDPLKGAAAGAGVTLATLKGGKPVAQRIATWAQRLAGVPKEAQTVSKAGREIWAEAIVADRGSIDNAIRYVSKLPQDVPVVAADIGENASDLAAAAASLRGPGKQKLVEELTSRQADQGERILGKLFRSTKLGVENAYDAADEIIATGRAASGPAYAKAYTQEIQVTDPIRHALNHPRLQKAYDIGRQIAADEDYAGVAHAGAKEVPALILDKAGKVTNDMIPVRALDYMKRGLDSMLESASDPAEAALFKQSGRAFGKLLRDAVKDAEEQSIDYKFAKAIFRDERSALESLQRGKGGRALVEGTEVTTPAFHTKPPQVIERELVLLAPTDRKLYVLGALQDLAEWVTQSTAKGPNVAQSLGAKEFGKSVNSMEARIRALFDDQTIADDVMDYLRGELLGSRTYGKTQGSRTPVLAHAMSELAGNSKNPVMRSGAGFALNVLDRAKTGWSAAISDEVSSQALKGMAGRDELIAYLESLRPLARRFRVAPRVVLGQQSANAVR